MTAQTNVADWREHLIESPARIKDLLENTRRVAVLGIKPDSAQPAYYVPEYAEQAGYEIVPVPVYYKELTEMMGKKVYRKLVDIPGDIDMVNVFRRPNDIPPHLDDIIAKKLRELSFTYDVPERWLTRGRLRRASVTLAGQNLKLWTKYGGIDPDVSSRGTNFQSQDYLQPGNRRVWLLRANLNF